MFYWRYKSVQNGYKILRPNWSKSDKKGRQPCPQPPLRVFSNNLEGVAVQNLLLAVQIGTKRVQNYEPILGFFRRIGEAVDMELFRGAKLKILHVMYV